jgi:hypothetical protein
MKKTISFDFDASNVIEIWEVQQVKQKQPLVLLFNMVGLL